MPDDSVLLGKADGQNHHRMWHSALVWWADSKRGYTSGAYDKGRWFRLYIKDLQSGEVRKYGSNHHDSLCVSRDGTTLSYYNLQNGDGSRFGDYRFCDKDGLIPEEDEVLARHGADAYFNIGGFDEVVRCKDCKHYDPDDHCYLQGAGENDYCSYGERGEENGD